MAVVKRGDLVRRARLRKGLTQQQVVDRCIELGLSFNDSSLSKIERNDLGCSARVLPVLAKVLDLTVDDLLAGDEAAAL